MTEPARRKRRWWRILRRVLLSLFLIAIILVYGIFPYWVGGLVANATTRSLDRGLSDTPATYGAEFKDVEYQTADGVTISAWLLPSRDRRATIIYSHGLFRSRRELLKRAVDLWKLGYGALLYDSRNHGSSGPAKVTLGYNERLDAEAGVRFLREQQKGAERVVLFGISMGAAAALLAAAETPEASAVIADSSFLSFHDTTNHHVNLLKLPAFPLANEMRYFIQRRAGFEGSQLNPLEAVARLDSMPVMLISAARDRRMPPAIAEQLYSAAKGPNRELVIIDGPEASVHGHAYQADSPRYIAAVSAFLTAALGD